MVFRMLKAMAGLFKTSFELQNSCKPDSVNIKIVHYWIVVTNVSSC